MGLLLWHTFIYHFFSFSFEGYRKCFLDAPWYTYLSFCTCKQMQMRTAFFCISSIQYARHLCLTFQFKFFFCLWFDTITMIVHRHTWAHIGPCVLCIRVCIMFRSGVCLCYTMFLDPIKFHANGILLNNEKGAVWHTHTHHKTGWKWMMYFKSRSPYLSPRQALAMALYASCFFCSIEWMSWKGTGLCHTHKHTNSHTDHCLIYFKINNTFLSFFSWLNTKSIDIFNEEIGNGETMNSPFYY